jgi:hypothetical protein
MPDCAAFMTVERTLSFARRYACIEQVEEVMHDFLTAA